mmetsp:Transcript_12271/g.14667  ORF Transcript_12271/g.14667 Transcript_12271/m.14667 type:complete len:86 (-) Transcript_12271:201-458(-)
MMCCFKIASLPCRDVEAQHLRILPTQDHHNRLDTEKLDTKKPRERGPVLNNNIGMLDYTWGGDETRYPSFIPISPTCNGTITHSP